MQKNNCSFQELPFSDLFKTYISDFDALDSFYETDPFDLDEIKAFADKGISRNNREQAADILKMFNDPFELHKNARKNLERLAHDDALTIVTGQQLGLYASPLYTIFKTVSAIHLARRMEHLLDRPVIPVFWMADEDHDYEEVRSLSLLARDELHHFELPSKGGLLPPVADLKLPDELQGVKNAVKETLYDTDFSGKLWGLLDSCYTPGKTFLEAFGTLISRLFSKHGLVLAGSNQPKIKAQARPILKQAVSDAGALKKALQDQTDKIRKQFFGQVTLYDSNLFYITEEGKRIKIAADADGWNAEGGPQWSTDELLEEIEQAPERFSPNVFLRPILQDQLLPTLGYVAGPGEIAYYGQMKQFYRSFGMQMPVIFPRMSATLVEPSVDRVMGELPFDFEDYDQRIEDLESAYVEQSDKADIETIFSEWKEQVDQIAGSQKSRVADIDPTLDGAAGKATAVYFGELDKLKGKVYRAVKQQDQTQLNRIRKIKSNLFPDNGLQERLISPVYFMNKFGVDLWDELLASLEYDESFDCHKLFRL